MLHGSEAVDANRVRVEVRALCCVCYSVFVDVREMENMPPPQELMKRYEGFEENGISGHAGFSGVKFLVLEFKVMRSIVNNPRSCPELSEKLAVPKRMMLECASTVQAKEAGCLD